MVSKKILSPLSKAAPGKNGFKYKERFGVIVICENEAHHRAVYEALTAQGHKCKAVRT
jgi:hypothetical protein